MCLDQDMIENGHSKPDRGKKQKYLIYQRRKIIIFHSSGQLQFSQGAIALKGGNVSKLKKSPKPKYKYFFKLATEFTRSTPFLFSGHPWTSTYSSKLGTHNHLI